MDKRRAKTIQKETMATERQMRATRREYKEDDD